ncbi:hypothetical protein [Moorena sp. SIO4G3]|uniref:hypothetical protein n=1 Tax=Moorena sp. SIO4G3 TaxID=2607821 RepID=UPI0014294CE4|nr:hypothetical protein [Moorena sp. SIO4G3]NEO78900.1 hypothetical protein [Moorena sp. SIO4G3]
MLISDLNHLESVDASQVQGGVSGGIDFTNNITSNFSTITNNSETDIFNVGITAVVDIEGITAVGNTLGEASSASGFNVATKEQTITITVEGPNGTGSKSAGTASSSIATH